MQAVPAMLRRSGSISVGLLLLGMASAGLAPGAPAPSGPPGTPGPGGGKDPTLFPEEQRAFFQDGPGWLLAEAERDTLLALDDAGRAAAIASFLGRDPIPETPENELEEGVRRRRELALERFGSPTDVRYRLLFLAGPPAERQEIDCGQTFKPIEIWTYPAGTVAGARASRVQRETRPALGGGDEERRRRRIRAWEEEPKALLYRPAASAPFRLWDPFDTKRVLYSAEMEYLLEQYEELRNFIIGKRFDLQTCPETPQIDAATGIEGLTGFVRGRAISKAVKTFLETPDDLAAWAKEAAATAQAQEPPAIVTEPLVVSFPRKRGGLIETRMLVRVAAGAPLKAGEDGQTELVVEGVLESGGEFFAETRVRYRTEAPAEGTLLNLAVDQALRPGQAFVARFAVRNEAGGGVGRVVGAFTVPREVPAADAAAGFEEAVLLGEKLAAEALAASRDSLFLAPPLEGQVVLGLWRAQALVSGQRIVKVVFLVDGVAQLTRTQAPWNAELRLATYPTEQIVRVEGYDAEGNLVASDEAVVNRPRGAFRVRLLEPKRGAKVSGQVAARAEVVVPEERTVERVEWKLNEEVIATLDKPPWTVSFRVPEATSTSYLAVTAYLDDGLQAEDVRILNAPDFIEEVDVRLVELYTTVTDRSGRPVRGLVQEDFEVFEDERPQQISKFELVENLPLLVGITIDTSGSMASSLVEAQRAGRAFLENVVTPRDRCFVVAFSGKPTLVMPPTDDEGACMQGLEGLQSVGWTALHDAVVTSLYYMREVEGQKALVLLSDGDDTASGISYDDALEYAKRSGVVIYAVGLNVGVADLGIRRKLGRLAEETGGRTFMIDKAEELAGVYGEIEQELRSRYLVAYAPDRAGGEGIFRRVEVRLKKKGLTARTMAGYFP